MDDFSKNIPKHYYTYLLDVNLQELLEETVDFLRSAAKTDLNSEGAVDCHIAEIQAVLQKLS
jgi:hypothetical protein